MGECLRSGADARLSLDCGARRCGAHRARPTRSPSCSPSLFTMAPGTLSSVGVPALYRVAVHRVIVVNHDTTIRPVRRDHVSPDPACSRSPDRPVSSPVPHNVRPVVGTLQAVAIYLTSRAIVALGVIASQLLLPQESTPWRAGDAWYHRLLSWDSEHYWRIAAQG